MFAASCLTAGGTLSNFPIHVFVSDEPRFEGAPLCATIGVRLSPDRTKLPEVKDGGSYLSSVFDTSRNLMDREFMFKNSKYTDWVAVSALLDHSLMSEWSSG